MDIKFDEAMKFRGWAILPEIIPSTLVNSLKSDLYKAVRMCEALREKNGGNNDAISTAHHLLGQGESFTELLCTFPAVAYSQHILGSRMVLNSFAGTLNIPGNQGYPHRVHRDIHFYCRQPLMMLNTLVVLDDFTEINGGTLLLSGSHLLEDKPTDEFFNEHATRILAKAGSILIFNSNIWHASGVNQSNADRLAVTMTFSHPDMRPQYDFNQFIHASDDNRLKQLLGGFSQTPKSLEQAYARRVKIYA
jgi:ectoine hydroxylase-related dioxygenase (phytanoyl-CoA dioxygenase family)